MGFSWTMTYEARTEAKKRSVADAEISQVIADPDVDMTITGEPQLRCIGRGGLYLVVDPESRTVVTLAEQEARPRRAATDDAPVGIRRRPVADRPHRGVPAALLAPPVPPPVLPPSTREQKIRQVASHELLNLDQAEARLYEAEQATPRPTPRTVSPRTGTVPEVGPVLPSVLNGTLAPRKRTAPPPPPAPRRVRVAPPPPPKDKLAGVHPGIAAGVRDELARLGLDESHVVVHSPTNVEIRRR